MTHFAFGTLVSRGPIELAWQGAYGNTLLASSYTLTGCAFGAAAADREIFVLVGYVISVETALVSATIGGVSASITGPYYSSPSAACALIRAAVPYGTSGDVVLNFAGNIASCGIGVYRVANRRVVGAGHTSQVSGSTVSAATVGLSGVSVQPGGFTLSVLQNYGATSGHAVSGLGTSLNGGFSQPYRASFASSAVQSSGATGTVTWSWASNSSAVAAAFSFA